MHIMWQRLILYLASSYQQPSYFMTYLICSSLCIRPAKSHSFPATRISYLSPYDVKWLSQFSELRDKEIALVLPVWSCYCTKNPPSYSLAGRYQLFSHMTLTWPAFNMSTCLDWSLSSPHGRVPPWQPWFVKFLKFSDIYASWVSDLHEGYLEIRLCSTNGLHSAFPNFSKS